MLVSIFRLKQKNISMNILLKIIGVTVIAIDALKIRAGSIIRRLWYVLHIKEK